MKNSILNLCKIYSIMILMVLSSYSLYAQSACDVNVIYGEHISICAMSTNTSYHYYVTLTNSATWHVSPNCTIISSSGNDAIVQWSSLSNSEYISCDIGGCTTTLYLQPCCSTETYWAADATPAALYASGFGNHITQILNSSSQVIGYQFAGSGSNYYISI